jgi:predicted Zn-dependent protease
VSHAVIRFAPIVLAIAALLLFGCAASDPASEPRAHAKTADAPSEPIEVLEVPPGTARPDEDGAEGQGESESSEAAPATGDEASAETTDAEAETGEEPGSSDAEGEPEKAPQRPGRIVLDTVYDDQRVGQDQSSLIEAELGLVEDEALNRYVTSVAKRLLRHATDRPFDYEFKIVDQSVPNAFALPGGKIYVSRGLLALAISEDELAGVIGHEITHATERHASARMDYSRRINPFTIGFLRAAAIAEYGRNQEHDADRGGQLLAQKAGYDPMAIGHFLRRLDSAERYEVGWARLPSYLATHPTSPQRAAQISDRASGLDWTPVPPIADEHPDGFFGMIDGLVIGDDPAGGLFVDDERFVHPDLGFSIRFPEGWDTMNTPQAVRALSPGRDAMAELGVIGDESQELDEAVDAFLEREFEGLRVRVLDRREIRQGDEPGLRIEGRATNAYGGLSFQMTFLRHEGLIYRLSMLTQGTSRDRYRGRARAFARSFRPLDEEGKHSLRVTRLRIARAQENETLQALCERTRNELEVVFTGVLNGRFADSELSRREPIKIGIAEPYIPRAEREAEAGGPDGEPSEKPVGPPPGENGAPPPGEYDASSEPVIEHEGGG